MFKGMHAKLLAVLLSLSLTFTLTYKTFGLEAQGDPGPVMDYLLIKYYSSSDDMFDALLNDEIDFMDYPLSYFQYQYAVVNPDIITGFYDENSYLSLNFNPYYSLFGQGWRSPTNYTWFRAAVACLVDKDYFIADIFHGFAIRIDTPIPRPIQNEWVNYDISKYGPNGELLDNYPWDYNPPLAASLLDGAGFVQGATDNPYYDPNIPWASPKIRVYPPGHEKAGQDLDPLYAPCYSRSEYRALIESIMYNLRLLGVPIVYGGQDHHLWISEYSLTATVPLHLFELYADWSLDSELFQVLVNFICASNGIEAKQMAYEAQRIIVEKAYCVPLASRKGVFAYRKGMVNLVNKNGQGVINELTLMNSYHESYPVTRCLRVGTITPPHQNIFKEIGSFVKRWSTNIKSGLKAIYEKGIEFVSKIPRISPIEFNIETYKKLTKTATFQNVKIETIEEKKTKVTIKVGNTVRYWHDGVPLTIHDLLFTLNYTDPIWYEVWENATIIDDFTAELYFNSSSIWIPFIMGNLEIIPKHIFETIDPDEAYEGYYPANLPPDQVLIGSGPWRFVHEVQGIGGYMLLEANRNYYTSPTPGEIDFRYDWDGKCYKIGLVDLVLLAMAYGSSGIETPTQNWDPSCDLSTPSGIVGLSDLVKLAINYGKEYH